jgi:Zn-dependent peptidase ImmA (M78 family)
MCLKKDGLTFILINSSHPRGKQHFTIAHELYHLFFQPDLKPHICNPGNLKEADINERLANAFAAELLMPKMGVIKMIPSIELSNKEISIPTVLKLENYFSVSHSSLVYRLSSLGLITKQQQDDLLSIRVKQTAQEYGFGLSLYQPGNEGCVIGDFGIKAKQLFTESRISESHYYELMNSIGIDPTLETNE